MTNLRTASTKELDSIEAKNSTSNEAHITQGSAPTNPDNKISFDLNQIKCFFPSAKGRPINREECPKKLRREPSETKSKQSVPTVIEQSKTKSNPRSSFARDDSSKSSRSRSKCALAGSDKEKSIERKDQGQVKKGPVKLPVDPHGMLHLQQQQQQQPRRETVNIDALINKNDIPVQDFKTLKNPEGAESEKYKNLTSMRPLKIVPQSLRYPVQKLGSNRPETSFRMIKPQIKDNQGTTNGVSINSQQKEYTADYELNVSKVAQHNSFYEDQRDAANSPFDHPIQEEEFVEPHFGKGFDPAYPTAMGNSYLITSFDGRRNTLPQTSIVPGKNPNPAGLKFPPPTNFFQSGIHHNQGLFLSPSTNMTNFPNTSYLSTESTHEGSDYYHNITPSTSANRLNSSLLSGLNSAKQDLNGSGKLDMSWNGEFSNTRGNLRKMGPLSHHQKYQNNGKLNLSFNETLLPSHYKVNSPAPSHDLNSNINYNQFLGPVLPQDEVQAFQHYPNNINSTQYTSGFDMGTQQPRMQSKIIMNNQAFMGTPISSRNAAKNVIPESELENLKKDVKSPLLLRNPGGTNKRKKAEPQGNTTQFEINLNEIDQDGRTTLMIKNIPNKYNIDLLMEAINKNHIKKYDFLYLPIDFKNKCNVGYAFINFLDTKYIEPFCLEFNGKRWEKFNSEKICSIKYARIQGRDALIQHFEFSSVMNQHDKKLRPVIVSNIDVHKFGELINKQRKKL